MSEMNRRGGSHEIVIFDVSDSCSSHARDAAFIINDGDKYARFGSREFLSCCLASQGARGTDDGRAESPPGNSFRQHVCDSVVPRKSVVGPPPPLPPFLLLFPHPSLHFFPACLAIIRHHCHLQRRISIFSIRPNLIEAVHRVRERINNAAVHYTCARDGGICGDAVIETRYTRHTPFTSFISDNCRDVRVLRQS